MGWRRQLAVTLNKHKETQEASAARFNRPKPVTKDPWKLQSTGKLLNDGMMPR